MSYGVRQMAHHFGVAVLVTGMVFAGYASYLSLIYPY